ncbi:MAG: hypothetical protein JSW39_21185 [Desulfobacterales bacterium]|nr:MAG: hypothetical protein JSW39_21185 [Desulfobacterales bacterium]
MKGFVDMLSQFNNEVLHYGPSAVLPQNLSSQWLERLQKIADDFLDRNFDLNECKDPQNIGDPILTACVYEILRYQHGKHFDITPKDMAEKLTIYALAVTMETANRDSKIGLAPPNLDNILSMDRIIAYKDTNPEFIRILKQACIVRNSEKNWFQTIKARLFSGVQKS